MSHDLEARVVELETRVAFQEHALNELNDALSAARIELSRTSETLRGALEELRASRPGSGGDPGIEPPPPHY